MSPSKLRHKTHEHDERPKKIAVGKDIIEIIDCDQEEYERNLKTDTYKYKGKKYIATGPEVFGTTYYTLLEKQGADLILKKRDEPRGRGYIKA
jgi:hypothetical protein